MTSNRPDSPREPKRTPTKIHTMPTIYEGVVWNISQEDRVNNINDRKKNRCKIPTTSNITEKKGDNIIKN